MFIASYLATLGTNVQHKTETSPPVLGCLPNDQQNSQHLPLEDTTTRPQRLLFASPPQILKCIDNGQATGDNTLPTTTKLSAHRPGRLRLAKRQNLFFLPSSKKRSEYDMIQVSAADNRRLQLPYPPPMPRTQPKARLRSSVLKRI